MLIPIVLFLARLFNLHVDFFIKSREPEPGADAKGGAKGKPAAAAKPTSPKPGGKDDKGGNKPGLALDGVFVLSPPSLDLKVDETQEVTVYAFPTAVSAPLLPHVLGCGAETRTRLVYVCRCRYLQTGHGTEKHCKPPFRAPAGGAV
jgi:hypothetical protein